MSGNVISSDSSCPVSFKRPLSQISYSIDSNVFDSLIAKDYISDDEFNLIVKGSNHEQRLRFIKRQLYYYLSDVNLSKDKFYRKRILEDSTKTGIENVLDVKYILTAKRMLAVSANIDDIRNVVSADITSGLSIIDIDGNHYIKLRDPLPEYVGKNSIVNKKRFGDTPETFHLAGPIVIISNIPPNITDWQVVKKAFHDTNKAKIRYISPICDGICYAWMCKSVNLDSINSMEITVNENPIKIDLINTDEQYKDLVSAMSLTILNSRAKDLQRIKSAAMSSPIEIGNFVIRNIGSIRNMLSNLLRHLDLNTKISLQSQAGTMLNFLIDYHPHAFDKKGGNNRELLHFEVGIPFKKDNNSSKCFHVVTRNNETGEVLKEDLSISKCLDGLRNSVHTLKKSDRKDFLEALLI